MSYVRTAPPAAVLLAGWSDDARTAIQANPDYFVWWYTAKSMALVGALAWVAYLYGTRRR